MLTIAVARSGGTTMGGPVPSMPDISANRPTAVIPRSSRASILRAMSASALPPPSLVTMTASNPASAHTRAAAAEMSSLAAMATGSGEMTMPAKHRSTPWRARRAAAIGWFWWTHVGFLSDGWPNWPLTTAPSSMSPGSITRGCSPANDFP